MWSTATRRSAIALARCQQKQQQPHKLLCFSTEAATAVSLNFNLPHETLYHGATVHQVIVPGMEGEYGITANHVPYVAQLKAGVVQIQHEEGGDVEKYFVAGGYALTHADSSTDVTTPEAVKVDDIDPTAVTKNYESAKVAAANATVGSVEQAEAQIAMEVNREMGLAVGVNLS